jgi:hypothetical protein
MRETDLDNMEGENGGERHERRGRGRREGGEGGAHRQLVTKMSLSLSVSLFLSLFLFLPPFSLPSLYHRNRKTVTYNTQMVPTTGPICTCI